jgi:hypothetical protein
VAVSAREVSVRARFFVSATLLIAIAAAPHAQQQAAPAEPAQLPVRRVVLYKSGVGYFEHRGAVTGSVDVAIQFTSGQLNDVLKSLTAIDLGDGRISSIGYNSVAPIEQRLAALRLPLGATPDLLQFYNALRGARVEVRTGSATISGRLLGIERKPRGEDSEPTDVVTIISTDGSVRTIALGPGVTVRIAEQSLREEIARYLAVVASGRDEDVRRMILSATGAGTRQLMVSYVSEVPIWKSTYRLVLPDRDGDDALLQGWAIVDNTVGEDWTQVELSLVAGAPQSFIQQVSQPYYARRPVVPLPLAVLMAPQTHDATLEEGTVSRVADTITPTGGTANRGQGFGGGQGSGVAGGVVGGLPNAPAERLMQMAAAAPAATAQELGDLFEYRLTQPVTIRMNQSALVPILNGKVAAARVALWNRTPGSGRPLRAVWLTNGTGLTLDGGTLSVIDAGAFAGEGLVDPLKPSEKRLVSYGSDLAMLIDARLDDSSGRYTRVIAREGTIIAEQEERNRWVYRARNEDAAGRTLIVEHPIRPGWTLAADPAPAETTATAARFVVPVAGRNEATLTVTERRMGETRFTIDELDDRLIVSLGQRGVSVDALRRALQPVMEARAQLADAERQLSDLTTQITGIARDQERVRENIKALGGSREERALIERYTRELSAQEDRLEALHAEIAKMSAERDARRAALSQLIQTLEFEVRAD